MRIKLDENLPAGITGVLANLGHDVDTVEVCCVPDVYVQGTGCGIRVVGSDFA